MNLESIPKSFWHSLSIAVLALTAGTMLISYKTGNLTLRYKDFEFETANAQVQIEEAKKMMDETLTARNEQITKLLKDKEALTQALAEAQRQISALQVASVGRSPADVPGTRPAPVPIPKVDLVGIDAKEWDAAKRSEKNLSIQKRLDTLGKIQESIKQQAKY